MSAENESTPVTCREVILDREPVELYKILKFEALAGSGAEAKLIIDEGRVRVNGETEYRRRRKILDQDIIECDGEFMKMKRG